MRRGVFGLLAVLAACLLLAQPASAQQEVANRTASSPAEGQFAVMAERFDAEDPARVLADQLRKKGLSPYLFETQAANGSAVFAVRLDIFDSLPEALQARETMAHTVKAPLRITPGGSAEPIDLESLTLYVQTGLYPDEAAARESLAALVDRGQENGGILSLPGGESGKNGAGAAGGATRYAVHAGVYPTYATAAKAAAALTKKGVPAGVGVLDATEFKIRNTPAKAAVPDVFAKKAAAAKAAADKAAADKAAAAKPATPPATAPTAPSVAGNATAAPAKATAPEPKSPVKSPPLDPPVNPGATAPPASPSQGNDAPLKLVPTPPNVYPPPE
ncbi:hypothetical protein [Megalodesulfovibrio paquesii]